MNIIVTILLIWITFCFSFAIFTKTKCYYCGEKFRSIIMRPIHYDYLMWHDCCPKCHRVFQEEN